MTENAQNADFRRKPLIFADSPLLLEIQAFGGRRKPQKTADFRRKPQIFAENRRKPQIGLCHLRCVTFSSALQALPAFLHSAGGLLKTLRSLGQWSTSFRRISKTQPPLLLKEKLAISNVHLHQPKGNNCKLSGPLNRLNAILSLLRPLDSYRTPSAIGSAIGRPYLALSRIHAQRGSSQPPRSKPLGGLNRAIVAPECRNLFKTSAKQKRDGGFDSQPRPRP